MDNDPLFDHLLQSHILPRWKGLNDKPEETPENTLRVLWLMAAGIPRSVHGAESFPLPELNDHHQERLQELVNQRMQGKPLAHITGRVAFMGIELLAGSEALIPRKETEVLGQAALQLLEQLVASRGAARVIDVCTGSGNLALALAYHQPGCEVFGSDLSPDAAGLAQKNAAWLNLQDRVSFFQGDLLAPFENETFLDQVDLIVCNPPYISSSKVPGMDPEIAQFEPAMAFDGGPFGLSILFRLIQEAPRFLKPGSWLCFEVGAGQGPALMARLQRSGAYHSVMPHTAGGEIRALSAATF